MEKILTGVFVDCYQTGPIAKRSLYVYVLIRLIIKLMQNLYDIRLFMKFDKNIAVTLMTTSVNSLHYHTINVNAFLS